MASTVDLVDVAAARSLIESGAARRIRVEAHLTLSEVARDLGVTPATVYRWERGMLPRGERAVAYGQLLRRLMPKGARRRTGGHANRQPSRSGEAEPTLNGGPDVAKGGATSPETGR